MFSDQKTTVDEMRAACIALVKRKGWGDGNGVQNPQHVAMAMTVEMSEVLEHFQWAERGGCPRAHAGRG